MENETNKIKKKFIPRKTPRFLPGQVSQEQSSKDLKSYNDHLYKLFTAKHRIDLTSPKLNAMKMLGIHSILKDYETLKKIALANKKLIMKINIINRTHGFVDCYNKHANRVLSNAPIINEKMKKINKENKELYRRLVKKTSLYSKKELEEKWKKIVIQLQKKAKYPLSIIQQKSPDKELSECTSISHLIPVLEDKPPRSNRPKVYIELGVKDYLPIGKIVFELYKDVVPNSILMFLKRIEATRGVESYVGECFYRIIPDEYCEIGTYDKRVQRKNTIYTDSFPKENFLLRHSRPGVLSLVPTNNTNNNVQFSITFEEYPAFDGVRVAIGKLIYGYKYLRNLQNYGKKIGKPRHNVLIKSCGIIKNQKIN